MARYILRPPLAQGRLERGAGGWIRPGDTVDLLGTIQVPGPDGQTHPATFPFMQRVKVQATGLYDHRRPRGSGPRAYGDITVVVSSREAQRLVFAIQNGTAITAVLRAPHDDAQEPAEPVRWETFLAAGEAIDRGLRHIRESRFDEAIEAYRRAPSSRGPSATTPPRRSSIMR